MLIQKNFIKMAEQTPFDPVLEKEKIALLEKSPELAENYPKYQFVNGQIRLRPSLTLTLSNNEKRVIYFDFPEQCERWKRVYRTAPPYAVISCNNHYKSVLDIVSDLFYRLIPIL